MKKQSFISLFVLLALTPALSLALEETKPVPSVLKIRKPDLIIQSISFLPTNPYTTDKIVITVIVKNIGTILSPPSKMEFRVGGESKPPLYNIESLPPGGTRQWKREVTLGVAQRYRVTATADANNDVSESREDNNVKFIEFQVLRPGLADITVESIKAPVESAAARIGERINLEVVIANIGTATATRFVADIDVEGQPDTVPSTFHNVRPGHRITCNRTISFSSRGDYVVTARVDINNEVTESNEANNTKTYTIIVR